MLRESLYFEDLAFRLKSLTVYKNAARNGLLSALYEIAIMLSDKEADREKLGAEPALREKYYEFVGELIKIAELNGYDGNIFQKHVISLFLHDENIYSISCERNKYIKDFTIYEMAKRDINTLYFLMTFDVKNLTENIGLKENLTEYRPICVNEPIFENQIAYYNSHEEIMDSLIWYYQNVGAGDIGRCPLLSLNGDNELKGVSNPDKISFDDIIGYESQKKIIIENTEAFVNGVPANNMLLTGSRGTGKSSCVKALAGRFFDRGLRIIEMTSEQIKHLPELLEKISGRSKKFILFLDDLSFEDFEIGFKSMKSILEGGVSARPDNVLFYATSNRRHIVQEKWSDKDGGDTGELHTTDSSNEKLSLSDRFGLTVTFPKPSAEEYLNIVTGLAKKEGIAVSEDFLRGMALKWELNQKGFSGRTAKQFINSVLWEMKKV